LGTLKVQDGILNFRLLYVCPTFRHEPYIFSVTDCLSLDKGPFNG
jgi:hypothetical protein